MPYWERAGAAGYGEAMYRCSEVERHIRGRCWQAALDIADTLGVPADAHVLDLGCGDGAFANAMLARYRAVDGLDLAEAAIRRADEEAAGPHLKFRAVDLPWHLITPPAALWRGVPDGHPASRQGGDARDPRGPRDPHQSHRRCSSRTADHVLASCSS